MNKLLMIKRNLKRIQARSFHAVHTGMITHKGKFFQRFGIPLGVLISSAVICFIALVLTRQFLSSSSVKKTVVVEKLHAYQAVFDPYLLKRKIDRGDTDILLVDIRPSDAFKQGHIRTAVSIPFKEEDSTINDYSRFVSIEKMNSDIVVIVYGDFADSYESYLVVGMLEENNIQALRLGVGWNEWRHFRNLWVPERDWDTFDITMYVD